MKKISTLLLVFILLLVLTSCTSTGWENALSFGKFPQKPSDTLEFWICENVDGYDFSSHIYKPGMFGGDQYYGIGYYPVKKEGTSYLTDPEHCVIYTVTSYPDYSDSAQHITEIYITDPNINVYGLTVNSSAEEFRRVLEDAGYTVNIRDNFYEADHGRLRINLVPLTHSIRISFDVSNREGIIF